MPSVIAKMLTSWRTTLAGGLPGVIMVLNQLNNFVDSDSKTIFDFSAFLIGLSLCGIGVTARDNAVTSKQAGAK